MYNVFMVSVVEYAILISILENVENELISNQNDYYKSKDHQIVKQIVLFIAFLLILRRFLRA